MLLYTRLERVAKDKHSSLLSPFVHFEGMKCCKDGTRFHILNTLFSLKLMNGPKKLECYFTLGLKELEGTIPVAYWAHSYLLKIYSVVNILPGSIF